MREETFFGKIRVYQVVDKSDMRKFRKFAKKIYQKDPNWTPQLNRDRKSFFSTKENPFFQAAKVAFFIAERDGKIEGRIAAISNKNHQKFHQDGVGFFGMFECVDKADIAHALLEVAADWLSFQGLSVMRGPMNFSMNDDFGCLLSVGNNCPQPARPLQPYNPNYYLKLFQRSELNPVKDCIAMAWDKNPKSLQNPSLPKGLKIRPIRKKPFADLLADLRAINHVYHEAWQNNWGFLPTSDKEQEYLAKRLVSVVDPNLMLLAQVEDEVVGMVLGVPDYHVMLRKLRGRPYPWLMPQAYRAFKKNRTAVIIAAGVLTSFRRSGLADYLLNEVQIRSPCYDHFESNWILEDNKPIQQLITSRFRARIVKRFRVFEKTI